jgi:diaminopimelate decarboxylase
MTQNTIEIQGVDLQDLALKYGTPLYVYDGRKISDQYRRFTSAFSVKQLKVYYACKALANINILRHVRSLGAGLDAVSLNEVRLGLHAGFNPEEIIFTPNMIPYETLDAAMDLGVQINIGSLDLLEYSGQKYPDHPVCIRINPHIMAGGNKKIATGHIDSKFGISIHQLPLAHRIVETLGMKVAGIHMHNGSDILDAEVFMTAANILFEAAKGFSKDLEYLDFGSGFKVKYFASDIETDIEGLGPRMSQRFNEFCNEIDKDLSLCFEPGKFLVSDAGNFLCQVNQVKQTTSTVFLGLNAGFNDLIRPMLYDAYHEIINISSISDKSRIYTVVGHICETDTFGINRRMKEAKPGDIICIKNAGAYCFEMGSSYNANFRPAEVFINNGKDQLIRKRGCFDDLLRNQLL